jgi:hypothetical protein
VGVTGWGTGCKMIVLRREMGENLAFPPISIGVTTSDLTQCKDANGQPFHCHQYATRDQKLFPN